ncbi:MAG: hypothetical protein QOH64_3072, partial [Acidimicrobiaceae bacterium]
MSFLDFRLKPLVVQRQLQAFSAWDKNANLRDALDRKDLLGAHGAATAVLARRLRERQGPEPPVSLPYPKDSGAYRQTFLLDPYDDIYYALLASSAAPSVQRGLPGSDVVLSTRFLPQAGGVFAAEDWRAANRRRGIVDRSGRLPFGGLDVQDQYLTTSPGVVVTALNTCQTPTFVVEEVVAFLEGLSSWPTGPIGLAAGPMASALFGTVSLLPVDRLLARLGVTYERWVDDIVIQCLGESHFETTVEAVDTQLRYRNQSLNRDKTWFEDAREAPLASQWADTSFDNSDDEVSLAALERAVEEANAPRCRFILGGLKWKHDTSAVPFVVHNDDAWRLAPKHSGDYL